MVNTSIQQDGASSSSPPNPPSVAEQRPPPAEANSNQVSHSSPAEHVAEAPSPLRDGVSSASPSNLPTQPEQMPTAAGSSNQVSQSSEPASEATPLKHPAPLPERPRVASDPSWKRKPPKFPLLIYNIPIGVVLSWNAPLTPNHEEIKRYELFWYKEGSARPSTSLWQKIRDVDALPLPMACSVSQLLGGHTYHFAIRAVDVHGRYGKFSETRSLYIEENKVADELRVIAAGKAKVSEEAAKDSNCEAMDSSQAKDGESVVSEGKDSEEKSAGLPSDSVKEVEKTVGCVKESEMAVGQSKEQDREVAQGREQEKAKGQAKEQEMQVQVKEEKEQSPCSC